jgi:hypothetical protein
LPSVFPVQEDEQLKKLVLINGAQKWSVVAEKIKVSPRTPHSTGPYSRSQLLQLTCRRMCAHCSAGTLRQELPFEVSIHTGAAALLGSIVLPYPRAKSMRLMLAAAASPASTLQGNWIVFILWRPAAAFSDSQLNCPLLLCALTVCRWWNHLNPAVKKGAFSEWEDAVIIKVRHWVDPTHSWLWASVRSSSSLSVPCFLQSRLQCPSSRHTYCHVGSILTAPHPCVVAPGT